VRGRVVGWRAEGIFLSLRKNYFLHTIYQSKIQTVARKRSERFARQLSGAASFSHKVSKGAHEAKSKHNPHRKPNKQAAAPTAAVENQSKAAFEGATNSFPLVYCCCRCGCGKQGLFVSSGRRKEKSVTDPKQTSKQRAINRLTQQLAASTQEASIIQQS